MRQNDGIYSFIFWSIKRLDGRKIPLVKNGWYDPKLWLGCLVKALGGDPQKVYCRGTITFYEMEDDVLTLNTETAWAEMSETRHFIESCFPGMKIYYIEEESGCERFFCNDSEGIYFKDHYYLDGFDDSEYYETIEETARYVKEIVGHDVEADFTTDIASFTPSEQSHSYLIFNLSVFPTKACNLWLSDPSFPDDEWDDFLTKFLSSSSDTKITRNDKGEVTILKKYEMQRFSSHQSADEVIRDFGRIAQG